jgi:transposase
MNTREQRGQQLAETANIRPVGKGVKGRWIVPSASKNGYYTVDLNGSKQCTCPDYELRRCKCKHVYAVEYTIQRTRKTETDAQGVTTVTETVTATKRKTYKQDWPAYNAAQTNEKDYFQILLRDLCAAIQEPVQTFGRPRLPLSDMVFANAFKVFSTVSGRRFMCDLRHAHESGYLSKLPNKSALAGSMGLPEMTPILHGLIKRSAAPLQAVETDFAVDSSGFSTSSTVTWLNTRYGHAQDNQDWIKVHLMCGVRTNVVTSLEISGRHANDAPFFGPLVQDTAQRFNIREVSADKGYPSVDNLKAAKAVGATPYIPFKSNSTGSGGGCEYWRQMWLYYNLHRAEFLEHYHKRSNVESTFMMVKAKFGGALRSKSETAQINEALCKILCHNICCVIQSMFELGIKPDFMDRNSVCPKSSPI